MKNLFESMEKSFHYKTLSNNQKETIKKGESRMSTEEIIEFHVSKWFAEENKDKDIDLVSIRKNIISISMEFSGQKHIIEISCPKNYPVNKKGFSCTEVETPKVVPLNFISLASKRFDNKKLSIGRVLTYLADIFGRYKSIKSSKTTNDNNIENNNTNVVFNTNAPLEPDDWNVAVMPEKMTSNMESSKNSSPLNEQPSQNEEKDILVPQILTILQQDKSFSKETMDHTVNPGPMNKETPKNIALPNETEPPKNNTLPEETKHTNDNKLSEGAKTSKDTSCIEGIINGTPEVMGRKLEKGNSIEMDFDNTHAYITETVIAEIVEKVTKSLNSEIEGKNDETKLSALETIQKKEIELESVSNNVNSDNKAVADVENNGNYRMDEEIIYADVDDPIGLYFDLGKYVRDSKFPFDENKLIANAKKLQEETNFGNISQIIKTFSPIGAINVILNEFRNLYYSGLKNNYSIYPINENLYHLKLTFAKEFFDIESKIYKDISRHGKSIEIEIKINGKLYPFYPPRVRLVTPGLAKQIYGRIATMECLLLSKWDPHFTIESIIGHFKKVMDQYGEFDSTVREVDTELENELIELSLLSEIPARSNLLLTIEELKNIRKCTHIIDPTKKIHGDNGTGYGHSGLKEWDFKTTLKIKEERDSQMMRCIRNIIVRLTKLILSNADIDVVGIIKDSCFIPYLKSVFSGNNMLELLKNPSLFEVLLNSMRIMDKRFIPLFIIRDNENEKSLYEILGEVNQECQLYINNFNSNNPSINKSDITNDELNLISNFISFYRRLEEQIGIFRMETMNKECTENKTFREIYRDALREEFCRPFENMNLEAFSALLSETRKNVGSKFNSDRSIKRIIKEILSYHNSLPMEPGSSIFYRYNPNNLRFHEFVVVGPEGTPYDAGCFHFRMYCTSEYPDKSPRVRLYTTGYGQVKFNPNFYEDGRICLSILGTWPAQAGESWIPEVSTMLQIMISIQSLVMNAEPYYNEPGNESLRGTKSGEYNSKNYNHTIRLETMRWAMIDMMKNPPEGFENALATHFRLRAGYIKGMCKLWMEEAPSKLTNEYKQVYSLLCEELDKLVKK
ncbi:MAG: ubiquitin-conjugating enzyme E2 [Nitrososphaerota archaeon]